MSSSAPHVGLMGIDQWLGGAIYTQNLIKALSRLPAADLAGRHAALAVEGHERVRRPPHRGRVDDGRVALQHARLLEPVHPPLDRRRGQADLAADERVRRSLATR